MATAPRSPNHMLAALPAADFELVRPHLETVELVQDAVLVNAGDRLTRAFFPHHGVIALVVRLAGGGSVNVAMAGRDSILGGLAGLGGNISPTDAIVQLAGTASSLDVRVLRTIAEKSESFRAILIRHEQVLFAQAQQAAACNAVHSVESRLARWLLRMHDLVGENRLHLTQDFLAQMIGVQRNSVSTVAHALQQSGIIRYSRGNIEITNAAALRKSSCECYEAVNAQFKRLLYQD